MDPVRRDQPFATEAGAADAHLPPGPPPGPWRLLDRLVVVGFVLALAALGIGCASALLPGTWVTGVQLERPRLLRNRVLRLAMATVVLPAAIVLVLTGSFSPFLYFQF